MKKILVNAKYLSIIGSFLVVLLSITSKIFDIVLIRGIPALIIAFIVSIDSSEIGLWVGALIGCWTLFIGAFTTRESDSLIYIVLNILPSLLIIAAPMYYRIGRGEE